jgi:hypothetical protein
MPAKLNTEGWIKKAQKKWGNRFDYSRTNYVNCDTDVEIGCPEHGFMFIKADSHIYSKTGCFDCGKKQQTEKQKTTFQEFLDLAEEKHGKLYTYTEDDYDSLKSKIKIHCNKHKFDFKQTAAAHLTGQGCPKCGKERTGEFHKFNKEEFIEKAKETQDVTKYDYSKLDLNNLTEDKKGIFICENGHEYEQVIYSHLQGIGCAKCKGFNKTTEDFILQSKSLYGDNSLDYSETLYVNSITPVILKCKQHKLKFTVTPAAHLRQNCGCQLCSGKGWNTELSVEFLKTRLDLLKSADPIELLIYLRSNGFYNKINQIGKIKELRTTQPFSQERNQILDIIKDEINNRNNDDENTINSENENLNDDPTETLDFDINPGIEINENRNVLTQEQFERQLMNVDTILESTDDENILSLIEYNKNKIWDRIINENENPELYTSFDEKSNKKYDYIKKIFSEEYHHVINMEVPSGWNKRDNNGNLSQPNLMQKWYVYRLMKQKNLLNLSDMGSGKTIGLILATKILNTKQTIIICPKAVVSTWVTEIYKTYPNTNIFTSLNVDDDLDAIGVPTNSYQYVKKLSEFNFPEGSNILIINKDKFQQSYSREMVENLVINNKIDFLGYDEVQDIKLRYFNKDESTRRENVKLLVFMLREKNPNLYFSPLSGTPIVNNFVEAVTLLELLTGKSHSHLKTMSTVPNGIEIWKSFQINGIRCKPKLDIQINKKFIKINGNHHIETLKNFPIESNGKKYEELFLIDKLNSCLPEMTDKFVIFNPFVGDITEKTVEFLREHRISYGIYNGEDKSGLNKFKRGLVDCLVCSSPISTGVDGLQRITNKIITTGVPYTHSELDQLIKRLKRFGSIFDDVNLIIPQIIIDRGEDLGEWSYDRRCFNRITFKGTIADLAVDGIVPKNLIGDLNTLRKNATIELKKWIERLENGDIITYESKKMSIPLSQDIVQKLKRKLGDFSEMNKTWNKTNSSTTHKRLKDNPEEWFMYHTLYGEARKNWDRIPYIDIANKINRINKPTNIIGDFGCGENLLKNEIQNKVLSFDHVAIDDSVVSCDISNVPLEDSSLDVVVLSLAMMHLNCEDYIKEAYRTLRFGGFIHIVEPKNRWEGKIEELKFILEKIGFKCYDSEITESFIYIDGIKI